MGDTCALLFQWVVSELNYGRLGSEIKISWKGQNKTEQKYKGESSLDVHLQIKRNIIKVIFLYTAFIKYTYSTSPFYVEELLANATETSSP